MTKEIYKTFEQWMNGNFLEVKEPRKKAYSKDELLLVEMGWKYGYDAGRAVEQALDKKAENARELGLDYEPVGEAYLCDKCQTPFDGAWECPNCGHRSATKEPVYTTPPAAQPAPVQEPVSWKWHQAPAKTSWGHGMVVADLAIDKDNTVSIYCERDQTNKVEAMFTLRKEST